MKVQRAFLVSLLLAAVAATAYSYNADPPAQTVKLIFIHHSTGENWLADGYGDLGIALGADNYFVSDTNYGWGPAGIGDRTDIPNWTEWFSSAETPAYMAALYAESEQHASYSRNLIDPGGENEIVMFKSCFPNSNLSGNPDDPPSETDPAYSVGQSKWVYNQILQYFQNHPEKLFVIIAAPPLRAGDTTAENAANARAFNNWLYYDWLSGYGLHNVAVFDFYNVLTHADAHHRYIQATDTIEHVATSQNTLAYPTADSHPSAAGSQKATNEYLPLLNIFYNTWKSNASWINPTAVTIARSAGGGSVDVHVPPGTDWTATAGDSWIHCTSGCAGSGPGTTGYSVDENTAEAARTGTMTIAGMTFTVHQEGLCMFCDDFEDGILSGDWNQLKGAWEESGGTLHATPVRKAIAVASSFAGCSTCAVEATMRTGGGTGSRVWLLGWYQGKSNTTELMMNEATNRWILKQRVNGAVLKKAKAPLTIDPDVDYQAKIAFDGTVFTVSINTVPVIIMPAASGTTPAGTVGFQVKATTGSFGSVLVN